MTLSIPASILCFLLLLTWCTFSSGTSNVTLIEAIRVTNNSDVSVHMYVTPKSFRDFSKNVISPLTSLLTDSNKDVGRSHTKLLGTVDITGNHHVTFNVHFLSEDGTESVVQIVNSLIARLGSDTTKPIDMQKVDTSVDNENEYTGEGRQYGNTFGLKVDKPSCQTTDAKVSDDKKCNGLQNSGCIRPKSQIFESPVADNNTDCADNTDCAVYDAVYDVVSNALDPLVNKVSENIDSITQKAGDENTNLVLTLLKIKKNLKDTVSRKFADMKTKLSKMKDVTDTAVNDVTKLMDDDNTNSELKPDLEILKGLLVQLRDKVTSLFG